MALVVRLNARTKKVVPAMQTPTVSFYNRRGTVDQLDGISVTNSNRKSMFLATVPEGSLPRVADYLMANYFPNENGAGWGGRYKIIWSTRDKATRDRDFMASIGYPLEPDYFLRPATTVINIGEFPTIVEVERALRSDIASRFTVTSSWPDLLWLLSAT